MARGSRTLLLAAGLLVLSSCQSGPQPLADGSYRAHASSDGDSANSAATIEIEGSTVHIVDGATTSELTMGERTAGYALCPPHGEGEAVLLEPSVSVDGLEFASPALFGDCGETSPNRITMIDLDSLNEGNALPPFTGWIEFCDTTDPDC